MTKMRRDPRIDPQPGDVLRKFSRRHGGESRSYLHRRITYGAGEWQGWMNAVRYTDGVVDQYCLLPAWKRWAKDAEVLFVDPIGTESADASASSRTAPHFTVIPPLPKARGEG